MVSLIEIDNKLQNSFVNIKKDMDSFRNMLQRHSERISQIEDRIRTIEDSSDSDELKELRKTLDKKEKNLVFKDDLKSLKKELENLDKKNSKEFALLRERLQNLRDDAVFKEDMEEIKEKQIKVKQEKPKKKKEKPEEPKEEKPKKKIFDKVIDFFAEED